MSRQELRRRMLLADPTVRDEDMTYGPDIPDDDEEEAGAEEPGDAAAEEGQQ